MEINEVRALRLDFLKKLYELTKANIYSTVSMWDMGNSMGLERDLTHRIIDYWIGEDCIKAAGLGGFISITHRGIKEVENLLAPQEQKQLSHPTNVINVKNMHNSQIQQGSVGSQQVYVGTMSEGREKGYIAGIASILLCIITAFLVFKFGWDLTGQVLTVFSALFGILGVGSLIKPNSVGQITAKILHNMAQNSSR